jgi:Spy/CpxP family protein refolding chaperone
VFIELSQQTILEITMHSLFNFKLLTAGVLLALSLSSHVYAQGPHPDKAGEHCKHPPELAAEGLPPFLRGINLTQTQKDEIGALMKQEHARFESNHQQRNALMKALHALSNAQTFDEKQAEAIATKFANLEKDEFMNRAKNGHQVFLLLTPEQRQKANENILKHMEKMDNMKVKPVNFMQKMNNFPNKIKG